MGTEENEDGMGTGENEDGNGRDAKGSRQCEEEESFAREGGSQRGTVIHFTKTREK